MLLAPKPRAPPKPRDRVNIEDLLHRLDQENLLKVTFRMERMAFNKLLHLLAPLLERTMFFGGEMCGISGCKI